MSKGRTAIDTTRMSRSPIVYRGLQRSGKKVDTAFSTTWGPYTSAIVFCMLSYVITIAIV